MKIFILLIFILGVNLLYAQDSLNTFSTIDTLVSTGINDSVVKPNINSINELKLQEHFDPLDNHVSSTTLIALSAVTAGVGVTVHFYNYNAWWKGKQTSFRIINDWEYALWIDKCGHFYGTSIIAHGLSSALDAANIDPENTAIVSSLGAFLFQSYVEIEDGFGQDWGFSPGDFAADFLGASYHLSKYYFPFMQNFQPRVSYYPSEEYLNGDHHDGNVIDDYAGQKYWMSMRMKELLPKSLAKYWPSFLMLSVGMGVKDLDGHGGGTREVFIALDLDWQTIPIPGKFGQFVKNTLNYFHLPMPGIKISPNTAFLVFCY